MIHANTDNNLQQIYHENNDCDRDDDDDDLGAAAAAVAADLADAVRVRQDSRILGCWSWKYSGPLIKSRCPNYDPSALVYLGR